MRRIAIIALFLVLVAASGAASATRPNRIIDLSGFSSVPVGTFSQICAFSTSTHVNVNDLRWSLRNRYARMKLLKGQAANCRMYYAPAIVGWDRITVTYRYAGYKYYGTTVFTIPNPQRPQ